MRPLVVFAYNFPHKKTQDVLVQLYLHGYRKVVVLAQDYEPLKVSGPAIRTKIRHRALLPPPAVAQSLGYAFHVVHHNSPEAVALLREFGPELGVIAGARILKKEVIVAFSIGIINLHPGLIPEARGLDALLWSILKDVPPGTTAHDR